MLICWCFCGSFCTAKRSIDLLEETVSKGHEVLPVGSFTFLENDTRFGKAADHIARIEALCRRPICRTIPDAEPIGPVLRPDLTVIAPCTGNTLSKIDLGVSDTPVTLAAKSHLRSGKPLLLAVSSNDLLGANFSHLASLYGRKQVFFLPLRQDDPVKKPFSAVADNDSFAAALEAAAEGKQLRPLFLS